MIAVADWPDLSPNRPQSPMPYDLEQVKDWSLMPPRNGDEPEVLGAVRTMKRPRSEGFHLGERLRHLRKERGMTLEDAGRLTALAASTL